MGKHSRPGPSNQPSRAVPNMDASDRLAAYNERRRPPLDVWRRGFRSENWPRLGT
ncbi:hypothetical protein [Streptomyces sp. NPDC101455]|uniref:hypothetical protein n=1 Tax=Streptomyces sp. NPDC101455 TaxID=3366142 RepID=UPI00380CD2B5